MTLVGWYCVAVGVLMLGWWAAETRSGALARPDRTRGEIGLHVAAEVLTASALVVGGAVLLMGDERWPAFVALGMLLYTVIQSPGYFLARREAGPVVMFGALVVMTIVAIVVLAAA